MIRMIKGDTCFTTIYVPDEIAAQTVKATLDNVFYLMLDKS
jgi:hypothetical protein